jgi:ApaG protein
MKRRFYYRQTDGVRITVRPSYMRDRSDPSSGRYVFAYAVRIENVTEQAMQLLSRRWLIHDSTGEDTEVVGDGVVGEQPIIQPGHVHEYQSFCVLASDEGYMEGHYDLIRADGTPLRAIIPRFLLDTGDAADLRS